MYTYPRRSSELNPTHTLSLRLSFPASDDETTALCLRILSYLFRLMKGAERCSASPSDL